MTRPSPSREPANHPKTVDELVAVVGMGCVLPDANNVKEFWDNVRTGRNSIRDVPHDRWDPALFYDPDPAKPDRTYAKIGAFVTTHKFNPIQFKIPPSVAKQLDETQKWALSAVAECLADAGYDKRPFDRTRAAVILGNAMGGEVRNYSGLRVLMAQVLQGLRSSPAFKGLSQSDQERILRETEAGAKQGLPEITEDTMPGELSNVIAGRVANIFDLSGKNFTTDAACASSFAAIDAAIKGLLSGDYDIVFTGGSDRSMDVATYVKFCKIGALSGKGSFPFDARADGFVMGEGAGILMLKRLSDAIRDGDRVRAVIRGVGSSSDAKGKGITAPNLEGQLKCIQRALDDARVDPGSVTMVECHGTSTRVGDVVELQALTKIFGPRVARKQSVPIGSIKSQIGHLKSAAGAASILKMILALENKTLPPSINFQTPNPNIAWAETPFYVNTQASAWPDPPAGAPRRAAISSFGFGGTNFNVVVEEFVPGSYPETAPVAATAPAQKAATPVADVLLKREPKHRRLEPLAKTARTDVLLLGASSIDELERAVAAVKQGLEAGRIRDSNFASYAGQTSARGVGARVRMALVVESLADLPDRLALGLQAAREPRMRIPAATKGVYVGEGPLTGKIAMMFPGQGSQYADMLHDLSTRFETVKRTLEAIDEVMTPFLGKPVTEYIFLDPSRGTTRESAEEALKQTAVTQPAVLTVDLALYRLLGDYGIKPDLVAGHSLGEYGALVAAGVMTLEDACIAVSARGREMANVHVPDLGKMASVTADPATVERMLKGVEGYVIPANKNCRVQTVIAGASKSVEAAVAMFNAAGVQAQPIAVSAAFHSEIVAPARLPLQRVFERLDIREPRIPILSNVTADYYPTGTAAREKIIDLLSRQVAAPVEWQRQTERMFQDGARLFVEVGPKSVLTTFTRNTLEGQPMLAVATNHPKRGGFYHFMDAIALLAAAGYPVRFPDPTSPEVSLAPFRDVAEPYVEAAPAAAPAPAAPTPAPTVAPSDPRAAMIQQLSAQLRQLQNQIEALAQPAGGGGDLQARLDRLGLNLDRIVVSGASVGLPGTHKRLFDDENFERVLRGENLIDATPETARRGMLDKNIVRLVKSAKGDHRFEAIQDATEVIRLAGRSGPFDLVKEFGINEEFVDALDITSELAIAAGIEALRDAGIPLVRGFVKTSTGKFLPGEWVLPEPLQRDTGVIFASAFPGYNRLISEISRYFSAQHEGKSLNELADIYAEFIQRVHDPELRRQITDWYTRHFQQEHRGKGAEGVYEFNRKFLFHVLSMGHAQLAQLIKAKGPNTQLNAACSSTTQAVAVAEDWIRTGRCKRVLVVGADDITGPASLEWFASGFLAAGAATTKDNVAEAALPFDRRRHGMIIGMGAVGLVVEADTETRARGMEPIVEVVASHIANSAYHGSRLDTEHVATEMDRLMESVERRLGVSRSEVASKLLFMSHETYTPARGGSAAAEIEALRKAFGADANKVLVSNTKGFTGHPMGASIEDAIAIKALQRGRVPPIANLRERDPALGDLNLSTGGEADLHYALRLAAGFGSQIAFLLFRLRSKDEKRIVDAAAHQAWLTRMSGSPRPELEVVNRTLRIKSTMTQPLAVSPIQPPTRAPVAPTPAPTPTPTPTAPSPPPQPVPARPAVPVGEIQAKVVALIADKTGYPPDMLDPNLDLEADLGIDTVKQAELFGFVRDTYQLPREDNLQLKDYPTIAKIAGYIASRLGGAVTAVTAAVATPVVAAAAPAMLPKASQAEVLERLVGLVAEKTGYPQDMLDPNLDLEADLGIDTVKQAEVFGLVREAYQLPRDDTLQLRDYPTLTKIAGYIHGRLSGASAPATPPAATAPAPSAPVAPALPPAAPPAAASTAAAPDIQAKLVALIAEKTGYPADMLDPNLDLEADLGIDTVKQAELFGVFRESYQLPRDDSLQLKDYPTIAKITGYIASRLGSPTTTPAAPASSPSAPAPTPPAATPPPPAPPAPKVAAKPAPVSSPDRASIVERIRSVIADKTGYPPDLLEEDLDLEADLGIDTVKQAELFGFVRETFNIPAQEGIQLSDYSTIGKVADFVIQNRNGPTTKPAAKAAEAPAPAAGSSGLRRLVVHYDALGERPAATLSLRDRHILVWGPPGHRAALIQRLSTRGATAIELPSLPTSLDEAMNWVQNERRTHPKIHGLLFVSQPNPLGSDFTQDDLGPTKAAFFLIKALLSTGKSGEFEVFGTATFLGGDFNQDSQTSTNPLDGALVGITKAVRREVPSCHSKAVDFAPSAKPDHVAETLLAEVEAREDWVEIGTRDGRGTLLLSEEPLSASGHGVELGPDDVLLVTGGGTGITSEACLGLAERFHCRFLLLGRTRPLDNAAELDRKSADELASLKTKIAQDLKAKGERATPVQVEREFSKITKGLEIHRTLSQLEAAGATAIYRACDVTDQAALQRACDEARKELGPITGIVHAAGVEESKLIVDKTPDSFHRVFDVKLLGARNALAATEHDPLRLFVTFSSIAGRFGNAGQADYSAANDALAKLGHHLRKERGADFSAITIDWSAWAEKGMATRGSIMTVLGQAGVTAIPLRAGVDAFVDEVAHGGHDAEVLVCAELGKLADPRLFRARSQPPTPPASRPAEPPSRPARPANGSQTTLVLEPPTPADGADALLHETVQQSEDEAVTKMRMDPGADPYLRDHAVDGVPYLPGVFGFEAFVETARRLAGGSPLLGARDVEYRLPAKCLRNQPLTVTVHARRTRNEADGMEIECSLESVFVNAKGETMGAPRIHFTATLLFGQGTQPKPQPLPSVESLESIPSQEIYQRFFHGPSFQVLDTLHADRASQAMVGVYAWPTAPLFGAARPDFVSNPMGRELAFQTAGGYDLFVLGALALPKGIRRVRFHDSPRPGERVLAWAHFRGTHDGVSRYDVNLLGDKGRVLEELHGFELIRIKTLAPPAEATAAPLAETSVYRARWGQDLPVPLSGARAVLVRQAELKEAQVTPEESLTSGERADQARYRNQKRAAEFFAGRLAAKEAIALLTDRPVKEARGIEIRRLESGEPAPRGKGTENIAVSISHTGDLALAVAAKKGVLRSIGIDAERIEDKPAAFTTEAFAPEEQALLSTLQASGRSGAETQVLCWAVKEAVLKALGTGFALDVRDVRVVDVEASGRVKVKLEEGARRALQQIGAQRVEVQAWTTDGHAYALGWTLRE